MIDWNQLTEFLFANPLISLLGTILVSLIAWRGKQHLSRHRELILISNKIMKICQDGIDYSNTYERRDFQDDVSELRDNIKNVMEDYSIKDRRIVETITTIIETCDSITLTWSIQGYLGDVDLDQTHAVINHDEKYAKFEQGLLEDAERLNRQTYFSLLFIPRLW